MKITLEDEAATIRLAGKLRRALPDRLAGWTVLLEGELGAGKSTLARGLLRAMGHQGAVPSPTYTLIEPYDISGNNIYHVDLYRVVDEEELRFLGWTELDDGFRLVEWPDRAPGLTATADLRISLSYAGNGREAEILGQSERGRKLVDGLIS